MSGDDSFSPEIIVEFRSGQHKGLRGTLKTVEVEVGKRIKHFVCQVDPGNDAPWVTCEFSDFKVIAAPDAKIIAAYNSVLIRNIKVREAKFDRVRVFFGGKPGQEALPAP